MPHSEFVFKELPLDQIQRDPDQPRKDFGTEGDANRLMLSIKELGIQQPLAVSKIDENRYTILDGHRRYICAQKIQLPTVPCRIYPKLNEGEFERIRFEIQNNRRPWKPLERSEALERIKSSNNFKTNKELSAYLHLSESLIGNSLQIRRQKMEYLSLMEKHDIQESYRVEFVRLKPKIRKIKEFEIDEIIRILFERVEHGVIGSAKEFRKLGRIFLRATANEAELYRFLSDSDMTVTELDQRTLQSGFSLVIEELIQKIGLKRQDGAAFSSQEKSFLLQLKELLNKVL